MSTGAAMTGAAVLAMTFSVPSATADATSGTLDGVMAHAPTCTAQGDVVISLEYPAGLPSGTSVQTNVSRFKFNPGQGATATLGATSGTVTFSRAELALEAASSSSTAFGLSTPDGRVFQAPAFSTTTCSGDAPGANESLLPTYSFGTPRCTGGDVVVPVAVAQAGTRSNELSLFASDDSLTFSQPVGAPAGATRAYSIVVRSRAGGSPAPGSHTVYVGGASSQLPRSVTLDLPVCEAAPAPATTIMISGPTWNCDTRVATLTYRNESAESRDLVVSKEGVTQTMPVTVPAGESSSSLPSGLSGRFTFRDATSHALVATVTLDPETACPPSTTEPTTPASPSTEPTTPTAEPTSQPTTPAGEPTHPATPTSSIGPKVDTDHVATGASPWRREAAVAGMALLAGMGLLVRRVARR